VQSGEGVMKMNDKEFLIKPGDVIFIPKNTLHSVIVKGKKPLKVLSIQSPRFDGDDRVMME
jgi:mannose-6-phosphate isomerase-like protein (cupin superfamily)